VHPYQLKHCVAKKEAAAGRALSGMAIRRSLHQTKLPQTFSAWRADGRTYKNVIDDGRHLTYRGYARSRC
jgi:hypothetical protein